MDNRKLTVADFFCGAGGSSEGFRQMGFNIVFALDNWAAARETHKLNHPKCAHPGLDCHVETRGNILSLKKDMIDKVVPDVDVIVGSPPCVSFSMANRAGKADKSLGMKLILKFLQIVAIKKHKPNSKLKYWIMENVPNSRNFLKERYTFGMLGLDNKALRRIGIRKRQTDIALTIDLSPERTIHNSVFYGVPQRRERFICGDFPFPQKTTPDEKQWMNLGHVVKSLDKKRGEIVDPNYAFHIDASQITDTNYNTIIPRFDWEQARVKKQQARYYGKMPFPEDFSRPSRTILATRSTITRESMILPNHIEDHFRSPTIREVASIMSFPVTYLFQANNESSKYRLVGNAVCPKMYSSFAAAILMAEGRRVPSKPYIHKPNKNKLHLDLSINHPPEKKSRDKHPSANFVEIVPDLKISNFRVELDNNLPKQTGLLRWNATIHHATGKDSMKSANPGAKEVGELLSKNMGKGRLKDIMGEIDLKFRHRIPSAKILQMQHIGFRRDEYYFTPREILQEIKNLVDSYFPDDHYREVMVSNLRDDGSQYIAFNRGNIPSNSIPIRVLFALFCLRYVTYLTNSKESSMRQPLDNLKYYN